MRHRRIGADVTQPCCASRGVELDQLVEEASRLGVQVSRHSEYYHLPRAAACEMGGVAPPGLYWMKNWNANRRYWR